MPQHFSVASNSPANRVEAALRITHLTRFFGNRITTFEHVARGKPEPDVFIEAARRAGYAPKDCIVVEDSVTGVTAAQPRGLHGAGLHRHASASRTSRAAKLLDAGAAVVFADMQRAARHWWRKEFFDIALQHAHMGAVALGRPRNT